MRTIRVIAIFALLTSSLCKVNGQNFRDVYDNFTKTAQDSYRTFRDSLNSEFARTISSNWEQFQTSEPENSSASPQPVSPTVAGESDKSSNVTLKASETVDTLELSIYPEQFVTHSSASVANGRVIRFQFFDSEQDVSIPAEYGIFHPLGISESEVARFWRRLGKENYSQILSKIEDNRKFLGYNDWASLIWIQTLASAIFPQNINSERTIFEVFVLNQMGLMAKLARSGDRLECLFASVQPVYARKYTVIDTYQYYFADSSTSASSIYTYRSDFSGMLRPLDLRIKNPIQLGTRDSYISRDFKSRVLGCVLDIPINQALMKFYESYPQTSVNVYAQSSPDSRFSSCLLGQIGARLEQMDGPDKIDELLRFVQFEFSYKLDSEQFGYEKQFFCEENFFYAANDCEDRAILFSFLVRHLTGNKVLLVEYDDHIATAVRFDRERKGNYFKRDDGIYYICDPTFIGATVGMCMPKYIDKKARIYVL